MNSKNKPMFPILAVLFGLGLVISALTNGQQTRDVNPDLVRSSIIIETPVILQSE